MRLPTIQEIRLAKARKSLAYFTTYTKPDYLMGWVHKEICDMLDEFLEAVKEKKSPRLIITLPPRSGKSELVSRRFPAYAFGRFPDLQIIATSYSSDLSQRFNRDVQRIIDDEKYQEIFPETTLNGSRVRPDSRGSYIRTSDLFEIVGHAGAYRSCGVGGGITGQGADCVTPDTEVLTPSGSVSITKIKAGCTVLSYNDKTKKLEECSVEAVRVKYVRNDLISIRSNRGRGLKVTPEHPIYSEGVYKRANLLAKGSLLLCSMQEGNNSSGLRLAKMAGERRRKSFLFPRLCVKVLVRIRRFLTQVCKLREAGQKGSKVLPGLSKNRKVLEKGYRHSSTGKRVSYLWKHLFSSASWARKICRLLLHGLQEQGPVFEDESRKEREIQGQCLCEAGCRKDPTGVETAKAEDSSQRQEPLCSVRFDRAYSRPPRGLQLFSQFIEQCCDPLRGMPYRGSPPRSSQDVQQEYVSEITRISGEDGELVKVYDLQVSNCHNFFANGILVHNCLIIDDPVKDRAEANSATVRQSIWDWYTSTAYTRLSPGGGVIVMATRWHLDDLIGRLIENMENGQGDTFTVINYPAIAEHDEIHRRKGEALHPERYSLDQLKKIQKTVGSRDWAALYQQHPIPDGGNIFKAEWFKYWTESSLPPEFDQIVTSWDMTFKDSKNSDYVVGQVWGKKGANFYLLDQVRGQWDFVKTREMFLILAHKWPKALRKLVEDKANGSAIISELQKTVSGIVPVTPKESKEARASAITPFFEAGNVYLPDPKKTPWMGAFEAELLNFPAGAHDDCVDSLSQCLNYFRNGSGVILTREQMQQARFRF